MTQRIADNRGHRPVQHATPKLEIALEVVKRAVGSRIGVIGLYVPGNPSRQPSIRERQVVDEGRQHPARGAGHE